MRWAVQYSSWPGLGIAGCTEPARKPRAAYLLIDAARLRSAPAQAVVNYFLSASSRESRLELPVSAREFQRQRYHCQRFAGRATLLGHAAEASPQQEIRRVHSLPRSAGHLDIAGALLYAVAQLGETNAGERYVLILANFGKEQIPEP